jgi:hypothetical protein
MDRKSRGLQHPGCYARALGGCSRKMSAEHYVSKCILELVENRASQKSKSVRVTGLSFQQPGVLQQFGISSLVGNVLCEAHNSFLSHLDGAGKAMFTAMDRLNDGAADQSSPERVLRVDGDRLERWVLKSMCGGLYSGAFRVSPTDTMKGLCPPSEWLHILFNGAEFPYRQGIYYMPRKAGETVTADEYVLRFEPLGSRDTDEIGGLRVWFQGFEFALLMGNIAKLVRHALSHAGGRETADLKKQKHGIKLVEGVLQIVPHDNHNLLRRLRVGVEAVVGVAASDPKFA